MQRTFHLAKRHRNLGIVCLAFFVLVGVASAYGLWAAAPQERRMVALYAAAFVAVFWGGFASLACWLLLAYWREELKISNTDVIQRGVIGRQEIDLHSVTSARWKIVPRPGGKIVLRTPTNKTTVHLGNFEPRERLWLIRFFRNGIPILMQENWDLFCGKIALPLRDRDALIHREPGPDSVRIGRRRWDWYFVPIILLCAAFGVVTCWMFQQPRMLVAPLMPALLWLVLRAMTPRQGLVVKRISAEPGLSGFLLFELCWLGVAVAGLAIFRIWKPAMLVAAITGGSALVLWFGVLLWRAHQVDRQRRERDEANAAVAVRQWEEGEEAAGVADGGE
jgi:hypothetical protein